MAEDDGKPIGFLLVTERHIDMLFVDPAVDRQGRRARGFSTMRNEAARASLECFRDNHAARRFYERHGWRLDREL